MPGRGFGGPPVFRGPPLGRAGGAGCLGLGGWVVSGLLGFLLGRGSRDQQRRTERDASSEGPIAIARRRYASGEISREEFEQIRRDLETIGR